MPEVLLVPMGPGQFESFLNGTIERYAEELREAGYASGETALKKSRDDTLALLPKGIDSPGHHFYTAKDAENGEAVGEVWIRMDPEPRRSVFIFALFIYKPHRGKGYGKATMGQIEKVSKEKGAEAISLHVFGLNERAIRLYRSCGYEVRSYNMGKELR